MTYTFISEIDRGSFGIVNKVSDESGNVFAMKVLEPEAKTLRSISSDQLRARFKREVIIQRNLSPEFVIPVLDSDLECERPWYLMPLADISFLGLIKLYRVGQVAIDEVILALADILNSLEALHVLGYTHRDLKPGNILKYQRHWKLADFGLCAIPKGQATNLTMPGQQGGTESYSAPEQYVDFKHVDSRADIYAFGCLLHDVFDGGTRIPFSRLSTNHNISPVIEKATEIDPDRRFQNVGSLRAALLTPQFDLQSQSSNPDVSYWIEKLKNLDQWTRDNTTDFLRFLQHYVTDEDLPRLFSEINEATLEKLSSIDRNLWSGVAFKLCEWIANGRFDFAYCDVLIGLLLKVYELGSLEVKAAAAVAASQLGSAHNRWFVMWRVMKMCSQSIDGNLATRIRIEILAQDLEPHFVQCAESITEPISKYHPVIYEALQTWLAKGSLRTAP